ncbi:hypothetical protein F4775DRAFT_5401 [Biscogniauxia sp. FL1348]|nr:hypothetical protein F4775DRAFT_5401 [Biscogniauxia sp. FL1348]
MAEGQEGGRGGARRSGSPQEINLNDMFRGPCPGTRTSSEHRSRHHHTNYEPYTPPLSGRGSNNPCHPRSFSSSSYSSLSSSLAVLASVASFELEHHAITLDLCRDSIFQSRGHETELSQDIPGPPVFYSRSVPIQRDYVPSLRGNLSTPQPTPSIPETPMPRAARLPTPVQGYTSILPRPVLRQASYTLSSPGHAGLGAKRRYSHDNDEDKMPPLRLASLNDLQPLVPKSKKPKYSNYARGHSRDFPSPSGSPFFCPASPTIFSPPSPPPIQPVDDAWEKKRDDNDEKEGVHGVGEEIEKKASPIHEGRSYEPRMNLLNTPAPASVHRAPQGRLSIAFLMN